MSTTPVHVPDGATASDWFDVDHHTDDGHQHWRTISGQMRTVVEGTGEWQSGELSAQAEAVQLANGELDMSPCDPPGVQIAKRTDNRLTIAQARGLAIALLQAADEADGWMTR